MIPEDQYDAAAIDGSTRWKNIFHITIPCIMPTLCIMLILNLGGIMSVGFEKIILMYSPSMYDVADVLSTYVYRVGLLNGRMSYTTAIDIFNTLCNLAMLITANVVTKKLTVVLRGPTALINKMTANDLVVTADLSGKDAGTVMVNAGIDTVGETYDAVGALGTFSVSVILTEKTEAAG